MIAMNELERFQLCLRWVIDGCSLDPERASALLQRILQALREEPVPPA
jgi:hypothetical protein